MRRRRRLATLMIGVAAALTFASPGSASASAAGPDQAAAATVAAIAAGGPATVAALPTDFKQIMGYDPRLATLADGTVRAVNPGGSCSVPGDGRPFDFTVACQAHDFGYDVLRYAERKHAPLAAAARSQIDRLLTHDMRVQCAVDASEAGCDTTAAVFTVGVGFNSWRQVSGPPVDESGLTRTAGLALLVAFGSLAAFSVARRRAGPGDRRLARVAVRGAARRPRWQARPAQLLQPDASAG